MFSLNVHLKITDYVIKSINYSLVVQNKNSKYHRNKNDANTT